MAGPRSTTLSPAPPSNSTATPAGAPEPPVEWLDFPNIKAQTVERRTYQVNLAVTAMARPSLVVLPTGMGKTVIALLVAADRLKSEPGQKIVIMAPTKPLVEQHARFFRDHLDLGGLDPETAVVAFSGSLAPEKRHEAWRNATFVAATPQVIENDLIAGRYNLNDVSLVIFDEVHRATGDYPYVWIAERYMRDRPEGLRLGLTASPGSSAEKILEVCAGLGLGNMEIRTETDEDVRPYVHELRIDWEKVTLPDGLRRISDALKVAIASRVQLLKGIGCLRHVSGVPTRRDLLAVSGELQSRIRNADDPDRTLFEGMSIQAQAMKISHALELAETQGAPALLAYWQKMEREAGTPDSSKATAMILQDPDLKAAVELARVGIGEDPKTDRVVDAVRTELTIADDPSIIIFANYRDTCERLTERLSHIPGCKPVRFVGQASKDGDKGLTQKRQQELIQAFRDGEYNVLVATSVAEEGLDIPQTDLVIFHEPVPSEIRAIQRRGRTARRREGRAIVLMYAGTRDEAYHWSARRREQNMRRELRALRTQVMRGLRDRPRERRIDSFPTSPATETLPGGARAPATNEPLPGDKVPPVMEPAADAQQKLHDARAPGGVSDAQQTQPALPRRQGPDSAPGQAIAHASPPEVSSAASATGPSDASNSALPLDARTPLRENVDPQAALATFVGQPKGHDGRVKILVDHRESRGGVVKALERQGVDVEPTQLSVADYALSERVAVERKTVVDFLDSLMNGRLFQQARQMMAYQRPILILEGEGLTTTRNLPRASIFGALASLATDYGISVLPTSTPQETADLLVSIAKREQTETRRDAPIRPGKVAMNDRDRRRFIIEGLPGVSGTMARRLLDHFGTVEAVMKADAEALMEVDGIGHKTAAEIRRLVAKETRE